MTTILNRLETLRVRDVMTREVVTVGADSTRKAAAQRLIACELSGAPVVDAQARCVGIVSATDFLRYVAEHECDEPVFAGAAHEIDRAAGGVLCAAPAMDAVRSLMTSAVQTVSADASLLVAARQMCAAHLHRLPVLDAQGRPSGMLTSLDIVAAVVNAADEAAQG